MAVVTTLLDPTVPQTSRQIATLTKTVTFPASGIGNGDNVQLFTFPAGQNRRLLEVLVTAQGSLGASATIKAQLNRAGTRTDLTTNTTAGAYSQGTSYSIPQVPFDALPGDVIEVLVSGAAVTASAVVAVDLTTVIR